MGKDAEETKSFIENYNFHGRPLNDMFPCDLIYQLAFAMKHTPELFTQKKKKNYRKSVMGDTKNILMLYIVTE